MTDEIKKQVIAIVAHQALVPEGDVDLSDTPQSLGLDSLGMVEIIFALEETFDIAIPYNANAPEKTAVGLGSVAAIIQLVETLLGEKPL